MSTVQSEKITYAADERVYAALVKQGPMARVEMMRGARDMRADASVYPLVKRWLASGLIEILIDGHIRALRRSYLSEDEEHERVRTLAEARRGTKAAPIRRGYKSAAEGFKSRVTSDVPLADWLRGIV